MVLVALLPVAFSAWRESRLPGLIERAADLLPPMGLRWFDGTEWIADPPGPTPDRAVLLIHGLDEPGRVWDQLSPALAGRGHAVVRFDYPNDQPATVSAAKLAARLTELRECGVGSIEVVAHSMGGLIMRDALTRPAFEDQARPGVPLVITLGTPHAGSPLARFHLLSEIREHIQRWIESDDRDPARLFVGWHDGRGEARHDLLAGSDYLTGLDERPWPPETRLVCVVAVLGRGDPPEDLESVPAKLRRLGDGLVPADSAVSEHADEVLFVRANHRSIIRTIEGTDWVRKRLGLDPAPEPPTIPLILERLAPPTNP